MTQEVQHAEVTVNVAFPVEKDLENDDRIRAIEECTESLLSGGDSFEFRYIPEATILHHTETTEEAAMRHMEEAEGEAMKKQQDRLERHWDNNGHY